MVALMEQLGRIVGPESVFDSPSILEPYQRDKSFTRGLPPSAVVRVNNASEVQEIVRWANQAQAPLIPVSSAPPHHRGDTVPTAPGAVIVDLSGMQKVVSVNRTHRVAVIEPGVTHAQLQAELAKQNLTLPTSLAPRAGKSVLTSLLETEPRLNALHQWCFLDPLRCVEVTWGDGNRMYTGEAGGSVMDLEKQWQQEKWQTEPTGPMMLDFYRLLTGAQGTMGIVTWASVKCEILPQIHKMYLVPAAKLEDLVDFAYRIIRFRFSDEFFLVNGAYLAGLLGQTPQEIAALRAQLPGWLAVVGIAGRDLLPAERVAQQEADIAEMAQSLGLSMLSEVGGVTGAQVLQAATSPSRPESWKAAAKGAFQDIFFTTTLDRTPRFIAEMAAEADRFGYAQDEIGIYLQPQNMGTSYHCEFSLPYDPHSRADTRRMETLFEHASAALSTLGAYYLRPYGIWSRLQLNRDVQSYAALQDLKGIFDPRGILNPGKLSNS